MKEPLVYLITLGMLLTMPGQLVFNHVLRKRISTLAYRLWGVLGILLVVTC